MMMSQSKIYDSNACTIIIKYCTCYFLMNIEQKIVVSRIMNLPLMNFPLMPCGLKHTPLFYFIFLIRLIDHEETWKYHSVRKVSELSYFCENLVGLNEARLHEVALNLHKHA